MEPRGRGRARGRARGGQQPQQPGDARPGPQGQPPRQQQAPGAQGAWGRPLQGSQQQGQGPRQFPAHQQGPYQYTGGQQGPPPHQGRGQYPPQPQGQRPPQQQAPGVRQGQPPQPPQQAPAQRAAAPQQSAWARAPAPGPVSVPHGVGRGSRQAGGDEAGGPRVEAREVVTEAGEPGLPMDPTGAGRRGAASGGGAAAGGVRGRPNRPEMIRTKPQTMQTKTGTSGKPINLTANFFELIHAGKWCLNQYRVDFNPDIDDTRKRKFLMRNGMKDIVKGGYLFDGTVMYTTQSLNADPLDVFVKDDNDETFKISVRLVGDVAWGDSHYIQLFNIIIRKCLTYMKLQLVGRNYFDPHAKVAIPEYRLELWPGYYTSMRQHEKNVLMNIDLSFKVMRMDNVYDILMECQGHDVKNEFKSKLIGSIVLTYYNNKTYKIDDVDFDSKPTSTFPMRDGTQVSYVQYYRTKYNINIQVQNQPMLISRSKPREIRAGMPDTVILVPELCQLTGLSDRQRENFQLMRALANHTRVDPSRRMGKLIDFSRRLSGCKEAVEEIRRWDLQLANDLVKFQGRVLTEERIVMGEDRKFPAGDKADWTQALRSNPMYAAATMERMAIICPQRLHGQTQDFLQIMQKCASGMKWSLGQAKIFDIRDDRSNSYLEMLENVISNFNPTLIMCVLPNPSVDRYSAIKKKCCVDRGVPTQIVLAKNLTSKGVMSIATKVTIQLNCKIGGAPWTVYMPLPDLMVVGYDVCRDTTNRGKSFGGMVASIDKQASRYFSYATEHHVEEELSDNFAAYMEMACHRYKENVKSFPGRIIIFRDGVGDGQLNYVYEHEVQNIKKRLREKIYNGADVRLAFVVVSKRINTRIFAGSQNPPPGTVVDDVITLPERYDFFIVSQCVRQGTVSPTSYNVIEDTMGLPPDRMQMLTYKMTHMYYNWSGTVRVPAPCQYAHKLAFLVSQSLRRPAHRSLENVLFYL